MTEQNLFLHEEVLLLALDDEKGTTEFGSTWQQGVAGAVVAELLLAGRVAPTDEKHPRLEVRDPTPLGEPLLDEILAEMAAREKPRKGSDWVQRLANRGKLKERVAAGLVQKRVLREEAGKILWIFDTVHYPERDGRPEREVISRLRRAIVGNERDVDPRTMVLVALADAAGLLKSIFGKQLLRDRKERLKAIREGEAAGKMTREAIEAVQAAVMVAAIMPAVFVATTSST